MVPSIKASLLWLFYLGIGNLLICSSVGFINTSPWTLRRSHSSIISTLPSTSAKIDSRQSNYRYFVSKTALFGRNKKSILPRKWKKATSIFNKGNRRFEKKNDPIEAGVGTVLVLGNKQRRTQWTKDVSKEFSWIPPKMLSSCIDGLASAFEAVAPKDLQNALQPGGLEKVRSKIEADFVRYLKVQPIIRQLPMPKDDKNKLVSYLVDLSLDFFMKDLESALAAPSVKLRALDQERREILRYMSVRQLAWYRLRHKPKSTIALGLLSLWAMGITLLYFRQNHNIALSIRHHFTAFKSLFSFLATALVQMISNAGPPFSKMQKYRKISWRK